MAENISQEETDKILDMRVEDLPFKCEDASKKLNGHQYQLAIKRAYLFLHPVHLENLKTIAAKAYKEHYNNTKWKFDEKEFSKFMDDFATRKVGGNYFTAPAVARYVSDTPVSVRDLFDFGIERIVDAKGVGNFTKQLFLQALKEVGIEYDATMKNFKKQEKVFAQGKFDREILIDRLQKEGALALAKLPAWAFGKDSNSAKEIKSAFQYYYIHLKQQLRDEVASLDKATRQNRLKFIENQVGLYGSIVDNKVKELEERVSASAMLDQAFGKFDGVVASTEEKFHHGNFVPKPKAHLNPREREI